MAPASKSKTREPDEDISQLRKPITLHGKPVEQILNSIHYGSPELRDLLLHECDMIFECKVCRALFRDLPNFISHKRRFCSKSVTEINHFIIGESPEERVIVVQPQPVDESEIAKARSSSSSSSQPTLEETLHRIRTGDTGNSYAFQVYSNAAAKLRHQKDHARITSLRPREIPTNSNAVFVDVKSTPVNIHDRVKSSDNDSIKSDKPTDQASSSSRRKAGAGKKRVSTYSYSNTSEKQLRSRNPTSSSKSSSKKGDELTDRLIKELKVIQNKVKNKSQETQQSQSGSDAKSETVKDNFDSVQTTQKENNVDSCSLVSKESAMHSNSSAKICNDKKLLEMTRQRLTNALQKTMKTFTASASNTRSSMSSSKASSDAEDDASSIEVKESARKSKRSLICPKCAGIFSSRKSLQFHIKTNHAVKRTFYPCPYCSNVYYYFNAVTRHLQRNHNKTNKEVDEMRQMLRAKAFSKPSPSQDTPTRTVAKLGMMGTRRSLRYKDKLINKRLGNAPFVYSSINKGKKVSAKRDPVLSEKDVVKSESVVSMEEVVNPHILAPIESEVGNAQQLKSTKSHLLLEKSEKSNNPIRNLPNKKSAPLVKKPFGDIGMQMQTCLKCSRLFGRKATYDKHINVCTGKVNVNSGNENNNKNIKEKNTINVENHSVSDKNKTKETSGTSSFNNDPVINSRPRRSNVLSNKDQSDSGDVCKNSSKWQNDNQSTPVKNLPQDVKAKLTSCGDSSPVNVKTDNGEQSTKPKRIPNWSSSHDDPLVLPESSNSFRNGKKDLKTECASNSSTEISPTVTRLKSKSDEKSENSGFKSNRNARQTNDDDVDESIKSVMSTSSSSSTLEKTSPIEERPRRKRKVPSRNMEAVVMLQKIHRTDEAESSSSEKKMKYSNVDKDRSISLNHSSDIPGSHKSNGHLEDEASPASRTKRRSSKIFISNNNKLECYNLSKVEKFMNVKKMKCRKCGAIFKSKGGLKGHVVRSHLRWSRYQCKICSFNCYHKSECSSHISRRHFKGKNPDRSQPISGLIIDLSKRGTEAMTLKKHQTIKAKSQLLQTDEADNIYRNQNAHRHPRLPDRKLERGSSAFVSVSPRKQQQREDKHEASCGSLRIEISPPSKPTEFHSEKDKAHQSRRVIQVSHLVPRKPRLPASTPQAHCIIGLIGNPHPNSVSGSFDTPRSHSATSSSKSDDEETSTKSVTSATSTTSSNSGLSSTLIKKSFPFNISTRKSPRVFDTSPYNREERTTSSADESLPSSANTNQVIMRTRHSAYTKTLPAIPISHKASAKSAGLKNVQNVVSVRDRDSRRVDHDDDDSEEEVVYLDQGSDSEEDVESSNSENGGRGNLMRNVTGVDDKLLKRDTAKSRLGNSNNDFEMDSEKDEVSSELSSLSDKESNSQDSS